MGKYADLNSSVLSIFGTPEWVAENIKTMPANFIGVSTDNEYIRVSTIPSGRGVNLNSVSGVLMIDIFTPTGRGPSRAFSIADILDQYLVGQLKTTVSGSIQFASSNLSSLGTDKANTALCRSTYTIPFNFFGVL